MLRINTPKKTLNSTFYIVYDGINLILRESSGSEKAIFAEPIAEELVIEKLLSVLENISSQYSEVLVYSINQLNILEKRLLIEKAKRKKIKLRILDFKEILNVKNQHISVEYRFILTRNFSFISGSEGFVNISRMYHLGYICEQVRIAVYKKFSTSLGKNTSNNQDLSELFSSHGDREVQQSTYLFFNSVLRDIFLFYEMDMSDSLDKKNQLLNTGNPVTFISDSSLPKEVITNLQRFLNRGVIYKQYNLEQILDNFIKKEAL